MEKRDTEDKASVGIPSDQSWWAQKRDALAKVIDDKVKPWTDRIRALHVIIFIVIGIAIFLYNGLIREEPVNKIAVVLPKTGPDSKSGKEIIASSELAIKHICENTDPYVCKRNDLNFQIVQFDDQGDPAIAQRIAAKIAADPQFLAVIGHFSSSVTTAALETYCTVPDLTIIMPVPTATDITSIAKNKGCRSVLRLPPSNRQQATDIAKLLDHLMRKNGTSSSNRYVMIFRDQSNPEYSNNLGKELLYALSRNVDGHRVALDIGVRGDKGGIIVTDSLEAYRDSDLIILGMTESALQSLRQGKIRGWRPDNIILTDGAVSEELQVNGDDVLDDDVYMLFQSLDLKESHFDFRTRMNAFQHPVSETSFAPYGYESTTILASVLEDVSRRTGDKISRRNLADFISKAVMGKKYVNRYSHRDEVVSFNEIGDSQYLSYTTYKFDSVAKRFKKYEVE